LQEFHEIRGNMAGEAGSDKFASVVDFAAENWN
jgi:hypothetical protein